MSRTLALRGAAAILAMLASAPATPAPRAVRHSLGAPPQMIGDRTSDYSDGYGTNAANSTAAGQPVGPYGGYVVNQYGYGNYVSGPQGFGGYPTGSAGAQIWKQRQEWKCQNIPERC